MAGKPRNKRELTRLTLIEATIQSIVEIGLPETTVTSIMQRAGLSRGMLHLHFGSKDELLEATAAFFAEDYYEKQEDFLKSAGRDPIDRLKAMIDADFSEELLNQTTAIVWYALRSVAHTNEAIRQHATTRDQRLLEAYSEIFEKLNVNKDGKKLRAIDLAYGLVAMTEGMWMDYFLFPANFNRKKAKEIVLTFVTSQIDLS
ncbi:TetR family transcriptional regulator C-terminal domain-containing protein [Alphaproteobacteria bacterium]|jgi:TetR/AcrR family transcriptional regulator, transcriptional repressor of bet genes|nr:TetR family transcriptional regulator C-terminal domain-containing protein [Alphaproteobacteria bacterium]